jgi:tRNA threonylcarbamoyladenosine biosynthesis protein TsaB
MMERILAIESATRVCSVAVAEENGLLGETSLHIPQVHAERLVVMINDLLDNLGLSYHDLDAIAFSSGPGSFTGLRIGLSVAKGIAFGQDKKLVAVPTLEALARLIKDYLGSGEIVVPILHARSDEFYYASFVSENLEMKQESTAKIAKADTIASEFAEGAIFVGEGVVEFSKHEIVKGKFVHLKNVAASAKEVAFIASEKFARGEFADLKTSVPMYIKDFIAIKGNPLRKLLEKI